MSVFLSSNLLAKQTRLRHGFFTRKHAISRDNPELKKDELKEVAKILGFQGDRVLTLSQVHSSKVVVVTSSFVGMAPEADALITKTPGLLLGVLTADCVPILLSSRDGLYVGAIHAGWRGAKASVVENTVQAMRDLGACDLIAALGPCIWQKSYEVSKDFYENFSDHSQLFIRGENPDSYYFDLPGFVISCLEKSGVKEIEAPMADTYSNKKSFYSFRRITHGSHETLKNNISLIGIS